jgi:phosphoglycerate kinase
MSSLMSHLGRPDGNVKARLTLKPVEDCLGELMGKHVIFLSDCTGAEVEAACADPEDGSIILLENLRFHAEEEGKGKNHVERCPGKKCGDGCGAFKPTEEEVTAFRASLAKLDDIYVNDAFGTAHAHSSIVGLKGKMPCVSVLLVTKELNAFSQVISDNVQRPLTVIVGGAKSVIKFL